MATWKIDPAHTSINFVVRHLVMFKVRGAFKKFNGDLDFDPQSPTAARVEVHIDAASIDTGEAQRDGHLRSPDFFETEKFPEIVFKSRKIEKSGADFKVTGDLTMHGVTKELVLSAESAGQGKDLYGKQRAGFTGKTSLDRTEFGLKWNQALEAGGLAVGHKIEIEFELQAIAQ